MPGRHQDRHGLTRSIAWLAVGGRHLLPDQEILEIVRMGFTDTAGVILAGRHQHVTQVMRRFVARHGERPGDSSVLFGPTRMAARDAALINATAGHALDYDDVAFCGHPSVVLVPALLAEGERIGASGLDLVRAYIVGYEVWAELFFREPDLLHDKGWHSTGVLGVVSATAALCCLRRLDIEQCISALSMSASLGSGVVANFGSEAKPFHAGQAAANAIDAVDLALLGMSSSPDAIEHPAGLLAALSPKGAVNLAPPSSGFGRELRLRELRLTFKNYPMCFATHRVIDCTIALAEHANIDAAAVARVHVHIGAAQAAMLRNHRPQSAVEAKFSLEFAIAAALVSRSIGLAQVSDDYLRRPDVRRLFECLDVTLRHSSRADQPSLAASDRVDIQLNDGSWLQGDEVAFARGDAFNPMTFADLRRKFDDCVLASGESERSALFHAMCHIDQVSDVRQLEAYQTSHQQQGVDQSEPLRLGVG
jgi:2-methylcitrate dehydratase PrpD